MVQEKQVDNKCKENKHSLFQAVDTKEWTSPQSFIADEPIESVDAYLNMTVDNKPTGHVQVQNSLNPGVSDKGKACEVTNSPCY